MNDQVDVSGMPGLRSARAFEMDSSNINKFDDFDAEIDVPTGGFAELTLLNGDRIVFSCSEWADIRYFKAKNSQESKNELWSDDRFIKIEGETFRCDCGCNVFRESLSFEGLFCCNSCNAHYRGE